MGEQILDIILRETGEAVSLDTQFEDMPLDSLEFLSLMLTIGEEVGKELTPLQMSKVETVRDVVEALR